MVSPSGKTQKHLPEGLKYALQNKTTKKRQPRAVASTFLENFDFFDFFRFFFEFFIFFIFLIIEWGLVAIRLPASFLRLLDPSGLDVVALVGGVAHGEGLAGEGAVVDDRAEKLVLTHALVEEADGVGAGDQCA